LQRASHIGLLFALFFSIARAHPHEMFMPEKELIKKYIEEAQKHGTQMTERDILFLWSFIRAMVKKEIEKLNQHAKE
jgi:hypothetical protein